MRDQWLAQVNEEIIAPELEICDPHHHLWVHPDNRYLLDDVLEDTNTGHRVRSTVFVECHSMYRQAVSVELAPVGETEFVQGIAAMSASGGFGETRIARGIVSFADLSLGQKVKPVLEAHIQASINRFRGIRHSACWHKSDEIPNSHSNPPNQLLLHDNFREGMSVLGELGLSFDAWLYHFQIPDFVDLAKSFPNVTMILDHLGGPINIGPYTGKETQVFAEWQENISELQNCPNVFFKLGGINMKRNGFDWHTRERPATSDELVDTTAPYYLHCIETFGVERCMFESNFPVDKDSCSYAILWNAFKKMTSGKSEKEKQALLHDTAHRVYRLEDAAEVSG